MIKLTSIILLIATTLALASASAISSKNDLSRIFQFVCKNYACDAAFKKCSDELCLGRQCDACMIKDHPECGPCTKEFDDDINFVRVGQFKYLLCDPASQIQQEACRFNCRRNYQIDIEGSFCVRMAGLPLCPCAGWAPLTL